MNMYAERTTSEKDKTGIPRKMKTDFEHSSGFSFDDVRVHYNSEKPARLHAHAYTQGNDVYVAPGQEKHLPHELGHVVQQKSDMVKPTGEIGGLPLNDDEEMENGADLIAAGAQKETSFGTAPVQAKARNGIVQAFGFMDFMNLASSSESYNLFAGPLSTLTSLGGMAGGIASFLYTKKAERKHRYIEEIEKYTDAACDAREEQIAAKVQLNEGHEVAEKEKALADALKLKARINRNRNTALQKSAAMGKRGMENQNVKDALARANDAYQGSERDFGGNKLREILPDNWQDYAGEQDATSETGEQDPMPENVEVQTEEENTENEGRHVAPQEIAVPVETEDRANEEQPITPQRDVSTDEDMVELSSDSF